MHLTPQTQEVIQPGCSKHTSEEQICKEFKDIILQ